MARNGTTNGHVPANRITGLSDRLPPHNLEAERGVLGGLLLDSEQVEVVRPLLVPDDFWREAHQRIYRALLDVVDSGRPADPILVAEELRRQGIYERIGGDTTVEEITDAVPHAVNTLYYAQVVRQKAAQRTLAVACTATLDDLYSGRWTVDEITDRLRQRVAPAEQFGSRRVDGEAVLVRLADVRPEPIRWLWPGRIPLGKLTLIVGDPGLGKSFLTTALAATISSGGAWPDSGGECLEPASVIILNAEDALADTIRPRLDAAGADVARVHALTTVRQRNGTLAAFRLVSDLPRLDAALEKIGDVRLLVIDPISAYLGGQDEHKNAEIRGLIAPLSELAERRNVAVVMITHLNKSPGGKAIYRATGSLAFVAAARVAWLVARDKDDPRRRLLLPAKSNIAVEPKGLAYRIIDGMVQWEAGEVDIQADDALAAEGRKPGREQAGERGPLPEKTRKAMDWVRERLEVGPGRHGELRGAAEEAGITKGTFYNALDALGVERFEIEGKKWLRLTPTDTAPEF